MNLSWCNKLNHPIVYKNLIVILLGFVLCIAVIVYYAISQEKIAWSYIYVGFAILGTVLLCIAPALRNIFVHYFHVDGRNRHPASNQRAENQNAGHLHNMNSLPGGENPGFEEEVPQYINIDNQDHDMFNSPPPDYKDLK